MSASDVSAEREAFETWNKAHPISVSDAARMTPLDHCWEAWQARAARDVSAERERCARIVEKAFSGVGGSSIADRIRRGEE